jgi:hypothetical protein
MLQGCGKMKIAIMACLFAKRDVEINAAHEPFEKSGGTEILLLYFPETKPVCF